MTGSAGFPDAADFAAAASQQKSKMPSRKPLLKAMAAALLASSSAPAVQAATCGAAALGGGSGGPPSISATEASTTQVLEEIRRRTQVAQQQMQPTPVSDTTVVPATSGGGSAASGGTAKPVAQGAPTSKPKYTKVASAKPTDTYEYTAGPEGYQKITASWGQAYLDYEKHYNIAPGSIENRDRNAKTAGYMSGTDWTWVNAPAAQAIQFGVYSGYNASFIKFGDTQFTVGDGTLSPFAINRTNSQQDITGEFAGVYLAALHGNATYDLTFKADLFKLHDSSLLTQLGACPLPLASATETGSASVNNYTIAGDASYKHPLTDHSWLEPTFSFRYTITDYGSDPTSFTPGANPLTPSFLPGGALTGRLGLNDGTVLRLQAGLRHGYEMPLANGGIWTVVTGAYIYSDVLITGFKFNPGVDSAGNPAGTTVFPVDEGKVRGLGQIVSTWDYNNHWSYLLAGEIRGGEDLFGVGGRIGARYRW